MSKADSGIIVPTPTYRPEDIDINTLHKLGDDSFAMWCLTSGVKVDNNPVDFENHRYLLPIYLDLGQHIVWQKAAQLGATSFMLLRLLWWLEKHQGRKAGLYFPTREGADNLSSDRLTPIINSAPSIAAIADPNSKLSLRKIGSSSLYIYHLGGVASRDSVPLDFLCFDEVRLCSPKDIDQTMERISHSSYKLKILMSTSGISGTDINARFMRGSQLIWTSTCNCPDGCDLARTFPDCVVDDTKRGKLYFRCPKCKYVITDPQNGRYVSHNPSADHNSYHVSQLCSKYISLKEVWDMYKHTTNMSEFYNAKLGLPHIDEDQRGVDMDSLKACVRHDLRWAESGKNKNRTAMGIDQGGGYLMIVIADINADGTRKRLRHIEVVERHNSDYFSQEGRQQSPFIRARELMREFNVGICVVDGMPNYDEALQFAQDFPRKVFTAFYQQDQKDIVLWGDKNKTKETIRKAGKHLKFKYHCMINRYTSMAYSLGEFKQGNVEVPNDQALLQRCKDESTGQLVPQNITHRFFDHLTRLIKDFHCTNEQTGEGKHRWLYAGKDPHMAHAWNYCNIGLERLRREAIYTFA